MKKNNIYFCGDIHGELRKLVWSLVERYKLKNISVVVCGDFGVGFGKPNSMNVLYSSVSDRLEKNNITIYTIRGNHDDPSWFDGKHDYTRLKFIVDNNPIDIEGWNIYPIGGATSIDRDYRLDLERTIDTKVFWEGEIITKVDKYPGKADIIVSHTAPISFEPVVLREGNVSEEIYNQIVDERTYLDNIIGNMRISYWFYGHFHNNYSGNIGDMIYHGLGIDELFELRPHE